MQNFNVKSFIISWNSKIAVYLMENLFRIKPSAFW